MTVVEVDAEVLKPAKFERERRRGDDRRLYDRTVKTSLANWVSAGENLRMTEDVLRVTGRNLIYAYRDQQDAIGKP